jgi:hypothetical protein
VVGYGFRDALWPDAPHKDLLTAAGPVVLVSNDLHAAWLSPAALAQTGRGAHPTGLLREHECFEILTQLPSASPDRIDAWVAEATRAAAARGVVGILDFEMADNITDWGRRIGEGAADVRVRGRPGHRRRRPRPRQRGVAAGHACSRHAARRPLDAPRRRTCLTGRPASNVGVLDRVDGYQDLPSDRHEADAAAITEKSADWWSWRRSAPSALAGAVHSMRT